ncbi:hypothetical protein H8D91_01135 [archaeon]|nr:hypothetical protein [archaeon]
MKSKYKQVAGNCGIGECPAVYSSCVVGSCPTIAEDGKEHYLVVGESLEEIPDSLKDKVGEGESVVRIPKSILEDLVKQINLE